MQNPLRPLTSTLSTYLVRAFGFQREFVGLASFNQLKYGKSYQVFTAHPTRRALPVFLRRNLPQPKKLTFTHLPDFCTEKGYVTVVKTSRTSFLRREEIRMYYSKILQKQYQKHFNLFFLLGSGSDSEETWVQRKVDEEWESHQDIVQYDFLDSYDNLPMKTFAGYQFTNEHCVNKDYMVFHDDDVFIKINELRGQMNKISPSEAHIKCLKGM